MNEKSSPHVTVKTKDLEGPEFRVSERAESNERNKNIDRSQQKPQTRWPHPSEYQSTVI
jgi:hypothetical protein